MAMAGSTDTNLGPLTTTFTPDPNVDCTTTFLGFQEGGAQAWLRRDQPDVAVAANCHPTSFNSDTNYYYSPGNACPSGSTTACLASETVVTCCPTGFTCNANRVGGVHDGAACTSSFTEDTLLTLDAVFYDRQSDIVTKNHTTYDMSAQHYVVTRGVIMHLPPPYEGLSPGAKAGIALGTILGVILAGGAILAAYLHGKRKAKRAAAATAAGGEGGAGEGAGAAGERELASKPSSMAETYGPGYDGGQGAGSGGGGRGRDGSGAYAELRGRASPTELHYDYSPSELQQAPSQLPELHDPHSGAAAELPAGGWQHGGRA